MLQTNLFVTALSFEILVKDFLRHFFVRHIFDSVDSVLFSIFLARVFTKAIFRYTSSTYRLSQFPVHERGWISSEKSLFQSA